MEAGKRPGSGRVEALWMAGGWPMDGRVEAGWRLIEIGRRPAEAGEGQRMGLQPSG